MIFMPKLNPQMPDPVITVPGKHELDPRTLAGPCAIHLKGFSQGGEGVPKCPRALGLPPALAGRRTLSGPSKFLHLLLLGCRKSCRLSAGFGLGAPVCSELSPGQLWSSESS